jgi:hypothetical protein
MNERAGLRNLSNNLVKGGRTPPDGSQMTGATLITGDYSRLKIRRRILREGIFRGSGLTSMDSLNKRRQAWQRFWSDDAMSWR